MKYLIFNELTETPLSSDLTEAITRIEKFLQTYKNRPDTIFDKGVRLDKHIGEIRLSNELTIQDLAFCQGRARTLGSSLLALGRFPYIEEGSSEEEQYILNNFSILKNNERVTVIGLAAAYLSDSLAIGFESESFWKEHIFPLTIKDGTDTYTITSVISVSSPEHFYSQEILRWIQEHTIIELEVSPLLPVEKPIHLRDDHGKDKLLSFAQRIVHSPYITRIINSCEFSPHNHSFIRKISDNGIIEITIPGTDQGLGMAIQTTGRNKRETEKIAELLSVDYAL